VRSGFVKIAERADPVQVHPPEDIRRRLAGWASVAAIAVLMIGLLFASGGPSAGRGAAGPAVGIPPVVTPATTTTTTTTATTATPTAPSSTNARVQAAAMRQAPADTATENTVAVAEPPVAAAVDTIGPLTRPVVVLYGDSLAWESRESFTEAFADRPDVDVYTRTFGGTAICDWLDEMAADVASLAPGIVVVEFSGNSFTPCMQDASGVPVTGPAITERYAVDAATVISTFAPIGTHVVFAGAPVSGPTSAAVGRMNDLYREVAAGHDGVWYADAGGAVLADDSYTITLPCLSSEPCEGGYNSDGLPVNVVRAPDGVHFCPVSGDAVQGVTDKCPVWSSGAYRYGRALAQPVIEALGGSTIG
jgi:hypothetical protein